MRLFAIGDTHLPSTRGKTMDRFGWTGHPAPLAEAWDAMVTPEDGVIVAGDFSWATKPVEVADDLAWLDVRPGKKVLLRGNHDFWWGDSAAKLRKLLEPYRSIVGFLQNSAVTLGPYLIAGSRLWTAPEAPPMPGGEMGDEQVDLALVEREARRLALSIEDARKTMLATPGLTRVVAVHFPPLYANRKPTVFSTLIEAFQPVACVYGHLHGVEGFAAGFQGEHGGVRYVLASCDAAGFKPVLLLDGPGSAASIAGVADHGGSPVG
ncbi:MAG TPA: metallophosphoesterase [Myxococcaceae bacterium]|nr:metallophosphoesterase [Myxococcaceae bacterium]